MNQRRVSRLIHCCHLVTVGKIYIRKCLKKVAKMLCCFFSKSFADLLESGKHRLNGQNIMEDPYASQPSRDTSVLSCGCKASIAVLKTISCPTRLACGRSCRTAAFVACLEPRKPWFGHRPVHLGFVVEEVALGKVSLPRVPVFHCLCH